MDCIAVCIVTEGDPEPVLRSISRMERRREEWACSVEFRIMDTSPDAGARRVAEFAEDYGFRTRYRHMPMARSNAAIATAVSMGAASVYVIVTQDWCPKPAGGALVEPAVMGVLGAAADELAREVRLRLAA